MIDSFFKKFTSNRVSSIIYGVFSGVFYGFYASVILMEPSSYECYEKLSLVASFAIFTGFSILFIIGIIKKDIKFLIPHICIEFTIVITTFGFFIVILSDSLYANSNLECGLFFGLVLILYAFMTWTKVLYFLQLFKSKYNISESMKINQNEIPAIAPVLTEKHNVV